MKKLVISLLILIAVSSFISAFSQASKPGALTDGIGVPAKVEVSSFNQIKIQ